MQTDYHTHTNFSGDGRSSMTDMCQRALSLGLTEIAFTEHAEWHPGWQIALTNFDAYCVELSQCRAKFEPQGLTIHSGVELGNPHEFEYPVHALLNRHPFDVVIGSMHWLGQENIHNRSCFGKRWVNDVYTDYFLQMGEMAASFELDFVAHFDRIFWAGGMVGGKVELDWLETVIRDTFAIIAERGQGLELNTRFLSNRAEWDDNLATMLSWFHEEGGQHVVVNTDAHSASQLGQKSSRGVALLHSAGFEMPAQIKDWKNVRLTATPFLS